MSPYGELYPALDWFVDFTPDSRYILFGAIEKNTGEGGLFRSTLDGSEIVKLTEGVLSEAPQEV